mmetsp:Transcript_1969/g.4439  ORF Transcript_1969/g.4439 Transcript_1969/m.4439 type:complete len:340 (+) Transcript_1969:91-1110(+)|eukprot:CAMPEP_0197581538 /NCGR_PEP_ID=MMETSP1326-20131121/5022_1 /TAXON_ID=1155430 /ORGANISM="Genus nov. species nov., Strain RCC2288" /LENGTH=339 /DNA_ID=CAMNT_0043145461 /DNA_START=74 /DNA_END=1096 /DNA_ORIENTATION=+
MSLDGVPVVDLAGDRATAVSTLDAALRRYGFFYVSNHGITNDLSAQQFQCAADTFALPLADKLAMPFDGKRDIGYVGSGVQTLDPDGSTQVTADTKEQIMFTNNKLMTTTTAAADESNANATATTIDPSDPFAGSVNYSPPGVPNHGAVIREYAAASYALNLALNALMFDALDVPAAARTTLGTDPFMVLKQMRYAGELSDPSKGKFGAGAHADWGSFTILATDKTPGLQIQMGDEWLAVPPREGCLIINSGDQIAQLTNDVYRSAVHRVVTTSTTPRFSTAIFTYFSLHAEVAPLPQFVSDATPALYPYGRTTDEYFHFKLGESFAKGAETGVVVQSY